MSIKFHAVALMLLGLWLGAHIGVSFFAAPIPFDYIGEGVGSTATAGSIAGEMFQRHGIFGFLTMPLVFAAVLVAAYQRIPYSPFALAMLGITLIMMLFEALVITPGIHQIRIELGAAYGSVGQAPDNIPARRMFGLLHGLSMFRALLEMIAGLIAFLAYSIGLLSRR